MSEPSASSSANRLPQRSKNKKKAREGASSANAVDSRTPHRQSLTTFTTPLLDKKGLLQVALRKAVTGGSFIDTKFYAFSRRRSTGVVDDPLPVYANSEILRAASTYFDGCMYFSRAHLTMPFD